MKHIGLYFLGICSFCICVFLFFKVHLFQTTEVILVDENSSATYVYDKNKETLTPLFDLKKPVLTVLRETKNSLKIKNDTGFSVFAREGLNVYRLLQESKVEYTEPKKIAILYISTGKYIRFWDDFYKNTEKYFLPRHKKTYFLFTNHDDLKVADNVVKIHQDQLPWPYVTLKRYHFFDAIKDQLKEYDYIYFLNGTLLPVAEVNEEIFPTKEQGLTLTIRGADFGRKNIKWLRYSRIKNSVCYVAPSEGKYYVIGGFNGGTKDAFLQMVRVLKDWTDIDLKNNIIPGWHDEGYLNRYYLNKLKKRKSPLLLMPDYAISETNVPLRALEFRPFAKMLILSKEDRGGVDFFRDIK